MDLSPGARIELDEGGTLELVSPARHVAPGLRAASVRLDGVLAVALLPDAQADDATRAETSRWLGRLGPSGPARIGALRVERIARARFEIGGYRDAVRLESPAWGCAILTAEPTLSLHRVMGPKDRFPWPPAVVARFGLEVARSMLDGSVRRLDPFSVGLGARGAFVLDPALDALLRPELREPGALQSSVAWLGYLAPEQIRKRQSVVSGPEDSAARPGLGVLLHELLTGRALYARETPLESLVAIRNGLPPALAPTVPGVPLDLAACVHALLDHDALRRPDPAKVLEVLAPHAAEDLSWCQPIFDRWARPCDVLRVDLR